MSDYDIARLQKFEAVFGILQHGTDQQSSDVIAQIRSGEPLESLASTVNSSSDTQSSLASSSEQQLVAISLGSSVARGDSGDYPPKFESQGFLDLLFDRNDWLHPTEGTVGHDPLISREEMQEFVPNPMTLPTIDTQFDSNQSHFVSQKIYDFSILTDQATIPQKVPFSGHLNGHQSPSASSADGDSAAYQDGETSCN